VEQEGGRRRRRREGGLCTNGGMNAGWHMPFRPINCRNLEGLDCCAVNQLKKISAIIIIRDDFLLYF
jgi:hypothetical protein